MMFGRGWLRLPSCSSGGHATIVALATGGHSKDPLVSGNRVDQGCVTSSNRRGRVRVPLAQEQFMQRLAFALLGLILAVTPSALADDWSKTYTISGKPDLRVETSDANIRVDTWDKNTIDVHITSNRYKFGDNGLRVIEHQNGDAVEIELRFPHHVFTVQFGSYKVDIEIHMTRQGRVNLRTGDGSIELANFKGDMDIESGDGHEQIDSVDGNLRARAGD